MSKFTKGDHVRVTNPLLVHFDRTGIVTEYHEISCEPASMVLLHGNTYPLGFKQSSLTLADPDVHEVLAEMAEQSGLAAESAPCITAEQWAKAVVPPNRRAQVLRTAESLVNGDRADDYGDPEENFQRIASLWSVIIGSRIDPEQVALRMAQVKIARLITSPTHQDSWIDLAGYAALGGEITERRA